MEKLCSNCNLNKSLNEFYKHKKNKDNLSYHCKDCISLKRKEYRENNRVKLSKYHKNYRKENEVINGYALYYLPEEHYVGFTNNVKSRLRSHKQKGRIIDGFEIIGVYSCPIYTHLLETRLHLIGYNGFQHKY